MKCLYERFWSKVTILPHSSCWLWAASKTRGGYGQLRVKKKEGIWTMARANRISHELHNGLIPEGMQVLHHCDVPACVNPTHLFLGTAVDNVEDKLRKGRHKWGIHSKISLGIAKQIRKSSKKNREDATEYGLSLCQISYIKNNKRWKESAGG